MHEAVNCFMFFKEKTSRNVYRHMPEYTVPEGSEKYKKPSVTAVIPFVSLLFCQKKYFDSQEKEQKGPAVGL